MYSLIVAIGKNNEIGKENKLLWHISEDLKNFKKVTSGKKIIMGRKTFESIGKPLAGRKNGILSRNKIKKYKIEKEYREEYTAEQKNNVEWLKKLFKEILLLEEKIKEGITSLCI